MVELGFELDQATSKAHEYFIGLQHLSSSNAASKDRLGVQKNESQTFLIKYLLSNCSLKYEIENGNADEDEMNSGKSLS